MPVERRQYVVSIKANVVEVRGQEFYDRRHGTAVVADGAVADLSLGFIFIDVFEVQFVIRFRYQVAFSVGNGVHRRDEPQREVAPPDVVVVLDIDVGGEPLDLTVSEVVPVIENTF